MKKILLLFLLSVWMPAMAVSLDEEKQSENVNKCMIYLKADIYVRDNWGRDKRAPAFIPISAFYDTDNLYLNSCYLVENTAVVVKDKWGNVMYEADVELLTDKEIVLPLNVGEGNYTLEITYGSICLSGDFEI